MYRQASFNLSSLTSKSFDAVFLMDHHKVAWHLRKTRTIPEIKSLGKNFLEFKIILHVK